MSKVVFSNTQRAIYVCFCVLYRNPNRWTDQNEFGTEDSGDRSPFLTPNPDLEGPGPSVLLEPWSLTFKGSLLNKSCSECSKIGMLPIVHDYRDRPMSGYLNIHKSQYLTYI